MTQDEVIETANQASKEWAKEYPTPEETAHQVPKRYLEIFAKLVAAKEREACAKICELFADVDSGPDGIMQDYHAYLIRARGQA